MLAIRLQRTGRSGHAQFRIIVQDAHRSPVSGNVVAFLGHFNPHTKVVVVNKEKASFYLSNGAQPTTRISRLFKAEGIKIPAWAEASMVRKYSIRNPEKLRRNRPPEAKKPAPKAADEAPITEGKTATETTAATDGTTADTNPAVVEPLIDDTSSVNDDGTDAVETSETPVAEEVKTEVPAEAVPAAAESEPDSEKIAETKTETSAPADVEATDAASAPSDDKVTEAAEPAPTPPKAASKTKKT